MRATIWGLMGLALLTFVLGGCTENGTNTAAAPQRRADLAVDATLVSAVNDFGFRALDKLGEADAKKTAVICPPSLELALAMAYNGASGDTKTAMAKALGVEGMTVEQLNQANAQLMTLLQNPDTKVTLAIANSIWTKPTVDVKQSFLDCNREFYTAKIASLDFAQPTAADSINGWVSDNTEGKITQLVDANAIKDAYLLLLNALYFRGAWTEKFDATQTQAGDFALTDGTKRSLPMMRKTGKLPYLETDTFQAVALPFGDKFVNCYVFLPKENVALADFRKSLTAAHWRTWASQFQEQDGTLVQPRFKTDYQASMKPALAALGMEVAFTPTADFSGMFATPPAAGAPAITDVLHRTALEVNEEGAEAAGATGVIVGPTAVQDPPNAFQMTVNRPFFCAIADKPTGTILFMGMITDPQ